MNPRRQILDLFRPRTNRHLAPLITAPNSITLMTTNSSMKRIINHALAALAALLISASNTNLHAATFSDDNWISMNPGFPGADDPVSATVVDGSGNLYISGWFTVAGDVLADRVAKWNGSSWSALGLGVNGTVGALAVSGGDLYAGAGLRRRAASRSMVLPDGTGAVGARSARE